MDGIEAHGGVWEGGDVIVQLLLAALWHRLILLIDMQTYQYHIWSSNFPDKGRLLVRCGEGKHVRLPSAAVSPIQLYKRRVAKKSFTFPMGFWSDLIQLDEVFCSLGSNNRWRLMCLFLPEQLSDRQSLSQSRGMRGLVGQYRGLYVGCVFIASRNHLYQVSCPTLSSWSSRSCPRSYQRATALGGPRGAHGAVRRTRVVATCFLTLHTAAIAADCQTAAKRFKQKESKAIVKSCSMF